MVQTLTAPLTMKVGRKLYPVSDYAEASRLFVVARDKSGMGGSQIKSPLLFRGGEQLAYVSYNGRVWAGHPFDWHSGTPLLCEAQ